MRFFITSIILGSVLLAAAPGCQRASLRCERETALLRAEILDLEDKYYALKSHHESMINGGANALVTNNVVGSGVVGTSPVVVNSWPVEGEVIYEDQMVTGPAPTMATPIMTIPPTGEVYYEGSAVPQAIPQGSSTAQPVISQPVVPGADASPTPAAEGPIELNMEELPSDKATSSVDPDLPEPTLLRADVPELEVGFEELETDSVSNGDVDRIEIISSATRGKDLDGIPGDDGLELMVRVVDKNGRFVDQSGELTVTIQDRLVGEIGKWTFLPEELKLFQSRDEFDNRGTLLHLPWTRRIPVSKQVKVRVSMMIGQIEYIASFELKIKPPTGQANSEAIVGWGVDDDRWISVSPATTRSNLTSPATPARFPATPSTAVKRPQWKPVR